MTPPELPPLLREERTVDHPLLRAVYLLAGVLLLLLGVVGWLVPVVTGIPFYLAGFALLGMSSRRVRRFLNAQEARLPERWRLRLRRILKRKVKDSAPTTGRAALPDWDTLDFRFRRTDFIFESAGNLERDPVWDAGIFREFGPLSLSPAAACLSYGLGIFEGMKARRATDGRLVLFRPGANARRFAESARGLLLAPFPEDRFVDAAAEMVRRNERFVPPTDKGTLYLRPMEHAVEESLGMRPCSRFLVSMYATPVGRYFQADAAGVRLKVLSQGRVARGGTGKLKAIGNYARGIALAQEWRDFDDILFLDARHEKFVTETRGSNVFVVMSSGTIVTPSLDDQILAGISRDSAIRVAREILGREVEERPLSLEEVLIDGAEMFCTGTAWTVQPVREIETGGRTKEFGSKETAVALYETLDAIQTGAAEDPFGWLRAI